MPFCQFDIFGYRRRRTSNLSRYGCVSPQFIIQEDHLLDLFRPNPCRRHGITLFRFGSRGRLALALRGHVALALEIAVSIGHRLLKSIADVRHRLHFIDSVLTTELIDLFDLIKEIVGDDNVLLLGRLIRDS